MNDCLQVCQLEQENVHLRQMLKAAQSSCHEAEVSLQNLCFEATGHRMAGERDPTFGGQATETALDFQDDLGLVRSSKAYPTAAPA